MPISLHECSVLAYIQTLDAVHGFLTRAREHLVRRGVEPDSALELQIHPDMRPLSFQLHAVVMHATGTVAAMHSGTFSPVIEVPQRDYTAWIDHIQQAANELRALNPAEVNAREGKSVMFVLGDMRLPFTIEGFVLSFSQPNFHFHATTAYDILRAQGVPLGKRDYLGRLRLDQ